MATYRGPAVVVDDDGEEHEVRADLTSSTQHNKVGDQVFEGRTRWSGTLTGSAPWEDFVRAEAEVTVRVGEREGRFSVSSSPGDDTHAPARIRGTGPAPFG